jgi:hypothetical protein
MHAAQCSCLLACRLEPNQPCSLAALHELGVLTWKLNADIYENDPKLNAIRNVRNYSYMVSDMPISIRKQSAVGSSCQPAIARLLGM